MIYSGDMAVGFDVRFEISGPSDDGTYLALCREFPMIIAATTEAELRQRIVHAVDALSARLQALGDGEDVKFVKEAGVKLRKLKGKSDTRTVTLPLSLGAAPR